MLPSTLSGAPTVVGRRRVQSTENRPCGGLVMSASLIFVHGAFCGGWAVDKVRKPFEAAGFATRTPDLPFHERGADLERLAQCGVRDYADAIVKQARDLPAPPVLIGHSLGGLVAQIA